jgi:hypothetical protein
LELASFALTEGMVRKSRGQNSKAD